MQADALRPGDPKRLGSYELLGRLGDGGQGIVFLGRAEDGTQVAIKLLHRELTADETARARFLREIDFAKQVASFCTAQVIDADIEGERPYLVSEYVSGPSVLQLVQAEGPIAGGALDRLAIGTATALVAIHQAGVIHRDFKPANVLIGPGGPRVIDFGIARVFDGANTMTSRVIGTPAFMSPEQLRGRKFGKEADIFCWAATIAFAATGRPPFGNDSIPAVIQRALNEEPDLGDLTGPLRGLLLDCLAKDPVARPAARVLLMRLLGQEDIRTDASWARPAVEDPAAILVKIAEATAHASAESRMSGTVSGPGASSGASDVFEGFEEEPDWPDNRVGDRVGDRATSVTRALAPEAVPPSTRPPRAANSGPRGRAHRSRAVVLTLAAVTAVAGTVAGTAYVLAQAAPGVRHVNNPTVEPVTSERPVREPTSTRPAEPAPAVRPSVRPTQSLTMLTPSDSHTTRRPTRTPTKTPTATPTPTPTPSEPEPSPTPPTPTGL